MSLSTGTSRRTAMLLEIMLQQDLDLIVGVEDPIEVEWSTAADLIRLDPDEDQDQDHDDGQDPEDELAGGPDLWED
jgi:hypothetical protein